MYKIFQLILTGKDHIKVDHLLDSFIGDLVAVHGQSVLDLRHETLLHGRVQCQAVRHEAQCGGRGVVAGHVEQHALRRDHLLR